MEETLKKKRKLSYESKIKKNVGSHVHFACYVYCVMWFKRPYRQFYSNFRPYSDTGPFSGITI